MPIALVHQAQNNNAGSATTTITVTMPATPAAGNLLVASIGNTGGQTVSSVSGGGVTWTRQVAAPNASSENAEVWAGPNASGSGSTSIVVTFSAASAGAVNVAEFSGTATTSPLDFQNPQTGTGISMSLTCTATIGDLAVAAISIPSTITGTPTGWTALTPGTSGSAELNPFYMVATANPQTATAGQSSPAPWAAATATFKAAPAGPSITSFTPGSGNYSDSVVITGTGFSATPASNTVKVNGTTAAVSASTTTSITFTIPSGATSGTITVTVAGATGTSATSLTINAPAITSFLPTSGGSGASVTVTGTGFDPTILNNTARLNGATATITAASATSITFTVPASPTSGYIKITTAMGTATSAGVFYASPTITSLTPATGSVGSALTIAGTNFDATTLTSSAVTFQTASGTTTGLVQSASPTSITVIVPATAITGVVSVTTAGGTAISSGSYTVVAVPTITSISPLSGPIGTVVTIMGTGFIPGSTSVTVGGVAATVSAITSTQITVPIPAGSPGGAVIVTTPGGSASSSTIGQNFTIGQGALAITSFTPGSGPAGTSVAITGTGFDPVAANNSVQFNGSPATVTAASPTSLTATVPAAAATGPISVSNTQGTALSSTLFMLPTPSGNPPSPSPITFSPASGPAGTQVTILGTGFSATPSANIVTVNGVGAAVSAASTTSLTITIPPGATSGPVSVAAGGATYTSILSFTVSVTPPVQPLLPDSFTGAEDNGSMTPAGLLPYLRTLLKDTATDIAQIGLINPYWSDADLLRFLELARGEYTRQRPKKSHTLTTTVANQQFYAAPTGSLAVDDVLWSPAGYDLDEISALAAALAGGPGLLWGGGVPVVGRVYFDSPASIQVWSIIREAWKKAFGGHWQPDTGGYNLMPTPTESGINVVVFYRAEMHWSDVPWQHRMFILTTALLYAVEALTYQLVVSAPAQGQKLNLGLRAVVQLIQTKYAQALNIREPGVTAGEELRVVSESNTV